jgi:DNA polymerase I-like protein with 3'-5' exonuclease and polymerase domains
VLGVNYGMTAKSLAYRIGKPVEAAQKLLELYSNTFKVFWRWGDGAVSHAQFEGELHTLFGWYMHYRGRANHRSQRNFLLQANGAELLRLACCRVAEKEVVLIAPIHDAILIEAPIDRIEQDAAVAEVAMKEASREMFAGFEIKVDRKIVRWPDRYMDKRGVEVWRNISGLLTEKYGWTDDAPNTRQLMAA